MTALVLLVIAAGAAWTVHDIRRQWRNNEARAEMNRRADLEGFPEVTGMLAEKLERGPLTDDDPEALWLRSWWQGGES